MNMTREAEPVEVEAPGKHTDRACNDIRVYSGSSHLPELGIPIPVEVGRVAGTSNLVMASWPYCFSPAVKLALSLYGSLVFFTVSGIARSRCAGYAWTPSRKGRG